MARGRPSKKQIILETAQDLFAKNGYQGTSIDLVVRAAGVSKPTVYNNFPSKQALLQSLIARQLDASTKRQQSLLAANTPALDKLFNLFQQIIEHPFEIALYRIYYGEPYKLSDDTMNLLKEMDRAYSANCHSIFTSITNCRTTIENIIALYKNSILINALAGEKTAQASELTAQIQVLGLINFK